MRLGLSLALSAIRAVVGGVITNFRADSSQLRADSTIYTADRSS